MSSGEMIAAVERLADETLSSSMAFEWTELMYLQLIAGNTTGFVFGGAVVLVFLVLAGQYESWSLPLAVILVVPMCILCSVAGVAIARMDINIFTQIGFVVLVGLASKNAILIVEFAKSKRESGMPRREATLAACKLRLRPILMTSFAFILGVVPLVVSTRGRRRNAADPGRRRLQRHVGRHPVRHLLDARLLQRDSVVRRPPRTKAGGQGRPCCPRRRVRIGRTIALMYSSRSA